MKILSIKRMYIWALMAIVTVALIISSAINLLNQIENNKQYFVDDIKLITTLTSRWVTDSVVENDIMAAETRLSHLEAANFIENLHVYRFDDERQLDFFTSYNKAGKSKIRPMFERIDELALAKNMAGIAEYIYPIERDGMVHGYVYTRATTKEIQHNVTQAIMISAIVLLISLIVCFGIGYHLQGLISRPVQELTELTQKGSRMKMFSSRANASAIREIDEFVAAFNGMLDKFEEMMAEHLSSEDEHNRLRQNLEEKVNQRTTALKEANQELIQTLEKLHQFQRQMVQNEKMASLGDMVAGVAHEVNTPIGLGVTASTMMLDRLNGLKKEFDAKALKASTLAKFIDEGQENLNIIYRNLNRAAELISSFKQVAVDQSSENNRVFSFAQLMDEILLSLRPRLKKLPHAINLHCDDDLYIETKAGPINQIMINLIINSVIHGFEFMDRGEIDIYAEMSGDNKLVLRYKDNGKGIPEHLRKRIFDPFVTTKRGQGGSGLGMHLVYNLVTQALNGSISITSEEGNGVEFLIIFPVTKVDASIAAKSS